MNRIKFDGILIRYSEIALKGRNRIDFEKKLMSNIKNIFGEKYRIDRIYGRLILKKMRNDGIYEFEIPCILNNLKRVFGIKWINPMIETSFEMNEIISSVVKMAKSKSEKGLKTFKVDTKRSNKTFPINSMEMNRILGERILRDVPSLRVNVRNPDFIVKVEIREKGVYIYSDSESEKGFGGLPVSTGGKALLMLSGGIDSPVAGWMMMKRGIKIDCVSFLSPPFTTEKTRWKIIEITKRLSYFSSGHPIYLFFVPITDLLMYLKENVPEAYILVIQRRMMMKLANKVADMTKSFAIITGDNIGQVASQTLYNLHTIGKASERIVLRPLLGYDKEEITEKAKEIETYDISIQPYPDLCVIFTPKNPATRTKLERIEKIEAELKDLSSIAEGIMSKIEKVVIKNGEITECY